MRLVNVQWDAGDIKGDQSRLILEELPSLDKEQMNKHTLSKQCHGAVAGVYQGYGFYHGNRRREGGGQERCCTVSDLWRETHLTHRRTYFLSLLKMFWGFLSHVVYISKALPWPMRPYMIWFCPFLYLTSLHFLPPSPCFNHTGLFALEQDTLFTQGFALAVPSTYNIFAQVFSTRWLHLVNRSLLKYHVLREPFLPPVSNITSPSTSITVP